MLSLQTASTLQLLLMALALLCVGLAAWRTLRLLRHAARQPNPGNASPHPWWSTDEATLAIKRTARPLWWTVGLAVLAAVTPKLALLGAT
jgi:hypothetical protein